MFIKTAGHLTSAAKRASHTKFYSNDGLHFDRLPVEQMGLGLPLVNSIDGRLNQQWIATDRFEFRHIALRAESNQQNNITLDVGNPGHRRIFRRLVVYLVGVQNAL